MFTFIAMVTILQKLTWCVPAPSSYTTISAGDDLQFATGPAAQLQSRPPAVGVCGPVKVRKPAVLPSSRSRRISQQLTAAPDRPRQLGRRQPSPDGFIALQRRHGRYISD